MREPDKYNIETLDMIDSSWREKDFSGYDVVFHVAGIAHVKETKKNRELFFKVNRDLAIEVAKVSKEAGVSQFIFLSSMSVYGLDMGIITKETVPNPKSSYGKSKLQAEKGLKSLESLDFKIVILRPPMIYGKGCKGNYSRLVRLLEIIPVFPVFTTERSALYIDNLCEYIRYYVDIGNSGTFLIQDSEYFDISKVVTIISGKRKVGIIQIKHTQKIVFLFANICTIMLKIFGDLTYSKDCINNLDEVLGYNLVDFETALGLSL
jgi:UDP-glucose 4-epimerase